MNVKHILFFIFVAVLALSGCGPAPEPTLSPADVQGTAMASALTMVAQTQAAFPTATAIPPTETPAPSPFPSVTPTVFSLLTPNSIPTFTSVPASGDQSNCNKPLTSWESESARVVLKNETNPRGLVTPWVYMQGDQGECGYIAVSPFQSTLTISVPLGLLSAGAFVEGKQDFKIFGGGYINTGSWSLRFQNERILLSAGCAPDC